MNTNNTTNTNTPGGNAKAKKIIFGILAVALVAVGSWLFLRKGDNNTNIITVGAILSLTGEYAEYGQNVKKGMDLAVSDFLRKNPDAKVRIIYEDNKGNAKDALTSYRKIKSQNPIAIIDGALSTLTLSIIPEITKDKIVLISTGASNPSLSGISPYFFRVWNSDTEEGRFIAKQIINKYNVGKINVLFINTDYGLGLLSAFKNEFSRLGGQIANEISFNANMIDFKDIVAKINFKNASACYLIGYANQTAQITKSIRAIHKDDSLIFSTVATEAEQFITLAGERANNVIYAYNAPAGSTEYLSFRDAYQKMYGTAPQILTDVAYDALTIILESTYSNQLISGEELKTTLTNMREHQGASGNIKFDVNGDVHKSMILKTIMNNKFVEID